jgi:hypothetical protein
MLDTLKLKLKVLGVLIRTNKPDRNYKCDILGLLLDQNEKAVIDLAKEGYLLDTGWVKACQRKESVGKDNEPIPWITYPATDFLSTRLTPQMDLFEFGAGNSTLYYAAQVASVTAIEHDRSWHDKIKRSLPENVKLIFKDLKYGGEYCRTASDSGKQYHIIVVDGRDRVNCIKNSLSALKDDGVMIVDDSQREEYLEGREYLAAAGFKQLDFTGLNPGNIYRSCTTVFYKTHNCIGL